MSRSRPDELPRDPQQLLGPWQDRCAEIEPRLRAFVPEDHRLERLRNEARALRRRHPEAPDAPGSPRLWGRTVGVKDIFHVDGLPTQGGSRLPPEVLRGPQGPAVSALLRAGALPVGKTATTEFAYFAPAPTDHPTVPGHTPGGSSSGSAAAVAAGLADLALGTQTIGSVIRPAAFCGVVGFKPSYERVSRDGLIPLAPSFDHVGWFARDVATVALAAQVLIPDWNREEKPGPRPRLAVPVGPYLERTSEVGLRSFETTRQALVAAGWEIVEVTAFEDFTDIEYRHRRLLAAETAQVHRRWFEDHGDLYHPTTRELIETGRRVPPDEVEDARRARLKLRDELGERLEAVGAGFWITPAAPGPAPRGHTSTGDPVMNLPWTQAGLPALGLPSDRTAGGLPLGLQVIAPFGRDETLLAWGEELLQAT